MSVAKAAKARSSSQWPCKAFNYILNSAEFPAETSQETACCFSLPSTASSAMPVSAENGLSGCRQVNFHISIRIESGMFCCVNASMVVSICVALAGLERRVLSKGVSGDGERKDHISQSVRHTHTHTQTMDLSFLTSNTVIHIFLCLISC